MVSLAIPICEHNIKPPERNSQDVRCLALACCKTAQVMHSCSLVHRDFRLDNVVRLSDDSWMVIDLELSSKSPTKLPSDYTQKGWDHATTEPSGPDYKLYTPLSDMHQIGIMLSPLLKPSYSQASRNFVIGLLGKTLSADQALLHEWLKS